MRRMFLLACTTPLVDSADSAVQVVDPLPATVAMAGHHHEAMATLVPNLHYIDDGTGWFPPSSDQAHWLTGCSALDKTPRAAGLEYVADCGGQVQLDHGMFEPLQTTTVVEFVGHQGFEDLTLVWEMVLDTEGLSIEDDRGFSIEVDFDGEMVLDGEVVDETTELGAELGVLLKDWRLGRLNELYTCPGCRLAGADLSYAWMRGAVLTDTDLTGANLQFASLMGADFAGADLSGADFGNANLTGATFEGALFFETVCPDGSVTDTGCP